MKTIFRTLPVIRLLATGMRLGSMVVRLLGLVVLARIVNPTDYGEFVYASVTAAFVAFIIGAELYSRTIFKLAKTEVSNWGPFVSRQYSAIGYILAGFWFGAVFVHLLSGQELLIWICMLATSDVLNQENNRLLVIAKSHVFAATMFFLRQALWLVTSLILLNSTVFSDPTNAVLCAWLVAGFLTAAASFLRLNAMHVRIRFEYMEFRLFRRFLQASALMLLSGLSLRALISLDKIVLGLSDKYDILAAYVLFASLTFALVPILDSAVFVHMMPSLVVAATNNRRNDFKRQLIQSAIQIGGLVAAYLIACILFVQHVLVWIGKQYYAEHLDIFFILMSASALYALAMLSYYGLYALKQKNVLFRMNAAAVVLCQLFYVALYIVEQRLAMPLAMLGAMFFLATGQATTLLRCYKKDNTWKN